MAELLKDPRPRLGRNAGSGIVYDEGEPGRFARAATPLDRDPHAAGLGEFDGIAREVEQNLPQPAFVAEDVDRVRGDGPGDLQPLLMRARAQQLGDTTHERLQINRGVVELQLAGFQPGIVEQVVHKAEQMLRRGTRRLRIGPLGPVKPGPRQQAKHADHAVEGRAHLVAHQAQELLFRSPRLRPCLRPPCHADLPDRHTAARSLKTGSIGPVKTRTTQAAQENRGAIKAFRPQRTAAKFVAASR